MNRTLHLGLASLSCVASLMGCGVGPGGQCECASTSIVTISVEDATQQPLSRFRGTIDGVSIECPPASTVDAGPTDAGATDAGSNPSTTARRTGANAVSIQYFTGSALHATVHVSLQSLDGSQSIDQDVSLTLTTDSGCCGGQRGSASVVLAMH